jgi:hypothetical protein
VYRIKKLRPRTNEGLYSDEEDDDDDNINNNKKTECDRLSRGTKLLTEMNTGIFMGVKDGRRVKADLTPICGLIV